jgi:hypothetical protein
MNMRKNQFPTFENPLASEVRSLENELFFAYQLVMSLIPQDFKKVLDTYYSCESVEATYQWEREAIEEIIKGAKILGKDQGSYFEPRAYCPLCGDGSTSPYDHGFAIPEGLRRHLGVWGGNRRCEVIHLVSRYARNYWDKKFRSQVEVQQKEKAQEEELRRRTETLFQIEPNSEPVLLDTGNMFRPGRSKDGITWAEKRIEDLGFTTNVAGNTKSYTDTRESIVVYADPTSGGIISFRAYSYPFKRKAKRISYFELRDTWKNHLKEKYNAWIDAL